MMAIGHLDHVAGGTESVGATFQLGGKFGIGRSGGIRNATLISLTSEERRARPHIGAS